MLHIEVLARVVTRLETMVQELMVAMMMVAMVMIAMVMIAMVLSSSGCLPHKDIVNILSKDC